MRQHGFSLVELSIVLVILGLLAGGILGGQSLMHAAALRNVSVQLQVYETAILSFKDRYFYLPGDMPNAVDFWGIAAGATGDDATCRAAISTDGTTCNGDGNGIVGTYGTTVNNIPSGNEALRSYQHLANAGLISGNFTGVHAGKIEPGINVPRTTFNDVGMAFFFRNSYAIWGKAAHALQLGTPSTFNQLWGGAFTPEDAWNLDSKLDDGKPNTGKVMGHDGLSAPFCHVGGSADVQTPDPSIDYTYELTYDSRDCQLYYWID